MTKIELELEYDWRGEDLEALVKKRHFQSALVLLRVAAGDFRAANESESREALKLEKEDNLDITSLLQQTSLYEWKRDLPRLKEGRRGDERPLPELIIERLEVAFKRIPTSDAYEYLEDRDLWDEPYGEYEIIKSIMNSPELPKMGLKKDAQSFSRLYREVEQLTKAHYYSMPLHPVEVAQLVRAFGGDLGVVFKERPSLVVWPLGRDTDRLPVTIMTKCRGYGWQYSAIRILPPEKERPRHVEKALSFGVFPDQLLSNPDGRGRDIQPTFQGIVSHSRPQRKPFPSANLPAELRNKIYEMHMSDLRSQNSGAFQCSEHYWSHVTLPVPMICRVSRRLRDEFLSLWFSQNLLSIRPTRLSSIDLERLVRCIIPDANRWLACSAATANLKKIEFEVDRKRYGRGFEISLRLSKVDSIFNGKTSSITRWDASSREGSRYSRSWSGPLSRIVSRAGSV